MKEKNIMLPVEQIQTTIAASRTLQEQLRIKNGSDAYAIATAVIRTLIPYWDEEAALIGARFGNVVAEKVYHKQYYDPKNGKFKNFIKRNICQNPAERERFENERIKKTFAADFAVETGLKIIPRVGIYVSNKINNNRINNEITEAVAAILILFTYEDIENAKKITKAEIELKKILDSFNINHEKQIKLLKKYKNISSIFELPDLSLFDRAENSNELKESISYMLYSIYCQKYGNSEYKINTLLDYYNEYINSNNKYNTELLAENKERYNIISKEQVTYLTLARRFLRFDIDDIPPINLDLQRIHNQAEIAATYDPFSERRDKIQKTILESGVGILSSFILKKPDLAIYAAATALSQFTLENNKDVKSNLEEQLKKYGFGRKEFNEALKQRKSIIKRVNKLK